MGMQNILNLLPALQQLANNFSTIDTNQDGVLSQEEVNIWASNAVKANPESTPFEAMLFNAFTSNYKTNRADGIVENTGTNNFNQLANGDDTASSADIDALSKSISAQLPTQPVVAPESTEPEPTQGNTFYLIDGMSGQPLPNAPHINAYYFNPGGPILQVTDEELATAPPIDYNANTNSGNISKKEPYIAEQTEA